MAEETVVTTTGQEPAQEGTPQPETVSLKDFLAHKEASKRRETKLKADNESLSQQLQELTVELDVLKQSPGSDATDDEIKAVKLALLKKHKEFETNNRKLSQREKELSARERHLEVKALAERYQVKVEDIEDTEDPQFEALKLYADRLEKQSKAPQGKTTPKFERGAPDRGGRTVWELSPEEFQKNLERLKREAAQKR